MPPTELNAGQVWEKDDVEWGLEIEEYVLGLNRDLSREYMNFDRKRFRRWTRGAVLVEEGE